MSNAHSSALSGRGLARPTLFGDLRAVVGWLVKDHIILGAWRTTKWCGDPLGITDRPHCGFAVILCGAGAPCRMNGHGDTEAFHNQLPMKRTRSCAVAARATAPNSAPAELIFNSGALGVPFVPLSRKYPYVTVPFAVFHCACV